VTWQRAARGIARLWIASVLALGLPAASQGQDASPSAEPVTAALPPATPSLEPAPAIDPLSNPDPPPPVRRLPGPVIDPIERAWSGGSRALRDRAERTRAAADEVGLESVDALARALVFGGKDLGSFEERAEAAVLLAPDLPAAHAALARARFASGSFAAAASSASDAIAALPRSLDAWLWLGATGWVLALFALAGGALVYLGARGFASTSHAAHDLGDRLEPSMPDFSRVALVAALVLLPAGLGEGLAGAALALLVFGWWQSARAQRIALACAALLFVAAIHPVANLAGARLAAIGADPIVAAAVAAEAGALDPVDAARLARAASDPASGSAPENADPLAMYALAQWARRSGDFAEADARLAAVLTQNSDDPVVLASAASAKIALGNPKEAVELYRRAIATEPTALLWFNLSQAHGRAIEVEQHARALAAAQSLDPDEVSELTARLAGSRGAYVADVPMPLERLRDRLASGDASAAADRLRRPLAPGWLGRSSWFAALAFAAAAALGAALGRGFEASTTCLDCGTRLCRHCGTAPEALRDGIAAEPRCEACRTRRIEMRAAAGWEPRAGGARAQRVRAANALGALFPGLAGRSARRPAFGLMAALCLAGALAFGLGADAVVPDPARVGLAGAIAFGIATAFCVTLYAAIALVSARLERRSRR
jgi:tetratricopeptide (TPR) repeat protein